MNGLDRKNQLLGESHGAANNRLSRMMLFRLAGQLKMLNCFHCNDAIAFEDFSIEHKEPWQGARDPKASFFDLTNIAFSHLRCNTLAGGAAWQRAKTHCPQGHEYTAENILWWGTNRKCRICFNTLQRRRRRVYYSIPENRAHKRAYDRSRYAAARS